MPVLVFASEMPCSVEALWVFHGSAEALTRLMPPGQSASVEGDAPVITGAVHRLRIVRLGVPMLWIARIELVEPPTDGKMGRFVDMAEKSPFKAWRHEHRMEATASGSRLTDTIEYVPPFGILGILADRLFLRKDIERLFAHRHAATRTFLTP